MVRMDVEYTGELRCRATHEPSGAVLVTDAPKDNHGKGEAFSPTDTLGSALATCMLTIMGIVAKKNGWSIDGTRAEVDKLMTTEPPRRVAKLVVRVSVPKARADALDPDSRRTLQHAAETCPVRLSLGENVTVETEYRYDGKLYQG